jgi:hypothetical protein
VIGLLQVNHRWSMSIGTIAHDAHYHCIIGMGDLGGAVDTMLARREIHSQCSMVVDDAEPTAWSACSDYDTHQHCIMGVDEAEPTASSACSTRGTGDDQRSVIGTIGRPKPHRETPLATPFSLERFSLLVRSPNVPTLRHHRRSRSDPCDELEGSGHDGGSTVEWSQSRTRLCTSWFDVPSRCNGAVVRVT